MAGLVSLRCVLRGSMLDLRICVLSKPSQFASTQTYRPSFSDNSFPISHHSIHSRALPCIRTLTQFLKSGNRSPTDACTVPTHSASASTSTTSSEPLPKRFPIHLLVPRCLPCIPSPVGVLAALVPSIPVLVLVRSASSTAAAAAPYPIR